ncbi:MAG: alpha,alpha-trehalase [Dysgonamonadaceae bacterium]|nr:alpha,alpha-trehalase [Dysgonamonadaceae bacterium]
MRINHFITLTALSPLMLFVSCIKESDGNITRVREFIHHSWSKTPPCTASTENNTLRDTYYWDTYFINEGLIPDNRIDCAKNNTDYMLHLVEQHGKMPNANPTDYLNCSQPPYLSMMVARIYQCTHDKEWLRKACHILLKEYTFWMTRRLSPVGLNHYSGSAGEAEIKEIIKTGSKYLGTDFTKKGLTEEQLTAVGKNLLAERESGWDLNPRFEGRCMDFCPIDLNANLYLYEKNFARFASELAMADSSQMWSVKAAKRKALLKTCCYNATDKLYYDYDYVNNKQSDVLSAAVFSLMYAGVVEEAEATHLVKSLHKLEYEHGIAACENKDYQYKYRWCYPNAWPPLQYIAVRALNNYNYTKEARRIAEKYVKTVASTYKNTGHLWEKYNVRKGTVEVHNEYEMPATPGWTAGVFIYLSEYLNNSKYNIK